MLGSFSGSTANVLQNYVPHDKAVVDHDVPSHMIDFWIAKRRVRIAEFKKEGEGKRSIYVNKLDVGVLTDIYTDNLQELRTNGEGLSFEEVLEEYPRLTPEALTYIIRGCYVESYQENREDILTSCTRKSDLDALLDEIRVVDSQFHRLVSGNEVLVKRDINHVRKRMIYTALFLRRLGQYNFHPIDSVNAKFLTVVVNKDTRLEYQEGFNIIDIVMSGKVNGLLGEETLRWSNSEKVT